MASEEVRVAYVFADTVSNRRFECAHVAVDAKPEVLSLEFEDGVDKDGAVLGAVYTPHHIVYRRPLPRNVEDGRR